MKKLAENKSQVLSVRLAHTDMAGMVKWFKTFGGGPFKSRSNTLMTFLRSALACAPSGQPLNPTEFEQIWDWYNGEFGGPPSSDVELLQAFVRKGISDLPI